MQNDGMRLTEQGRNRLSLYKMMWLGVAFMIAFAQSTFANSFVKQDVSQIKTKVEEFLQSQVTGYPGKVAVVVGGIDPALKLPACESIEMFLPAGSRAWGKTSVGARCLAPTPWTVYVQADVSVQSKYYVAAVPLAQGHVVTAQDVIAAEGDLTKLPAGIFTEVDQIIGRTVNMSMIAGSVLRHDLLKQMPVVQQGQTVLITSRGNGFSVSAEGKALKNASEGQVVQVKVQSGQVVSGIARAGSRVEVTF